MKKTAAIISACMLTFALSACSGSNYVMQKKAPQLGGATLITMDRQGKCTGSEKR